jgi:hypothetical protein
MAWPKKMRGARSLQFGGRRFVWRLETGVPNSKLVVRPYDRPQASLTVVLRDRADPWLCFGGVPGEERSLVAPLGPVTPGFVANTIRRALALGWEPGGDRRVMTIQDPE